jgi:hypothetical protein
MEILNDSDTGLADGFSINMIFKETSSFHNIEIAPAINGVTQMDTMKVENGSMIHCNHYLRLKIEEYDDFYMAATKARYETLKNNFTEPKCKKDVLNMLGDTSHKEHWVFRCKSELSTKTICVGVFDLMKMTWSFYKDNPKTSSPIMALHLSFD